MPIFIYKRQRRYPDLDIEVGLNLNPYPQLNHTANAWLKAKGSPGDRARWRDDFWAWARDRELDAYSPRYGNKRSDNASAFDCYLRSWQVVADFLIYWVGIESLSTALADAEEGRRADDEVAKLSANVQALSQEVAELRAVVTTQSAAFRNVGLAILASSAIPALMPPASPRF